MRDSSHLIRTYGDNNITIDDPRVTETSRGDRRFTPRAPDDRPYEIAGTYYLSNSLAVLRVAQESGRDSIDLQYDDLVEAPVEHICGSIRERYWHGVTRTIDEKELAHIFADEKSKTVDGYNYVYVPYDDTLAQRYFREVAQRHPECKSDILSDEVATSVSDVNGAGGV